GANWMSHSYSPLTRLLYVFARDERRVFTKNVMRHGPGDEDNAAPTGTVSAGRGAGTPGGGRGGEAAAPSAAGGRGGRGGGANPGNIGAGVFGAGGNLPAGGAAIRGRGPRFAPEESWGKVVAIDPLSGDIKWEHKVISPPWGGVMATAGNVVFGGTTEGVV